MVIILFDAGLCRSAFSTISFQKLISPIVSRLSVLSVFAMSQIFWTKSQQCYQHLKKSNCHVILFSPYKNSRSSHRRCIKAVTKKFAILTGKKTVLESLYSKVSGLSTCNVIKNRLQNRCFLVSIAKFLTAPILKNICERLLLKLTL